MPCYVETIFLLLVGAYGLTTLLMDNGEKYDLPKQIIQSQRAHPRTIKPPGEPLESAFIRHSLTPGTHRYPRHNTIGSDRVFVRNLAAGSDTDNIGKDPTGFDEVFSSYFIRTDRIRHRKTSECIHFRQISHRISPETLI